MPESTVSCKLPILRKEQLHYDVFQGVPTVNYLMQEAAAPENVIIFVFHWHVEAFLFMLS